MRALVTGAAGFIGRHVVRHAASRGIDVIAVSRVARTSDDPSVRWIAGDLLDPERLDAMIAREKPTHLLHLAWITEPGVYWTSPANAQWAASSTRLFERFFTGGGRRAVAAGTCAEYDWSATHVDARTPLIPRSPYGVAKAATRDALKRTTEGAGASQAWGRIHFLYGPGEPVTRLVPSLALPLLRGQPAICRKPTLVRDWLHVSDVAAAFVALLESDIEGAADIVSGSPVSHGDLARHIAAAAGSPETLHLGNTAPDPGEPLEIFGSAGALAEHWRPTYSLADGVAAAVAALRIEAAN